MGTLPKYTLKHDDKKDNWALQQDKTGRTVKTFDTKTEATKGRVLENAVGGSVRIQKENGRIQEERTYPGSADPKKSPG